MRAVTIVCDPISEKASVQFSLVTMVMECFHDYDRINILSPFIPYMKQKELLERGASKILTSASRKRLIHYCMNLFKNNESMLWAISWLLEALFAANSSALARGGADKTEGMIVNISYTTPLPCEIFWNQATPPLETLRQMSKNNLIARVAVAIASRLIGRIDLRVQHKHFSQCKKYLSNSRYSETLFKHAEKMSDGVIYIPKVFNDFRQPTAEPTRDYVLAYLGKEVEIDTILKIANFGVKIVAFGAKIPYGTPIGILKKVLDFHGYVEPSDLELLYYNALFTLFPFTEEPFGWVPLESMHFGTPVLSYNKQGPAETVIDGKSGWLVDSRDELVSKALELWSDKDTKIDRSDCIARADFFSIDQTRQRLNEVIGELELE